MPLGATSNYHGRLIAQMLEAGPWGSGCIRWPHLIFESHHICANVLLVLLVVFSVLEMHGLVM
jgi:hypothetical protein